MGNKIILKHGSDKPVDNTLSQGELGYCTGNGLLYTGDKSMNTQNVGVGKLGDAVSITYNDDSSNPNLNIQQNGTSIGVIGTTGVTSMQLGSIKMSLDSSNRLTFTKV